MFQKLKPVNMSKKPVNITGTVRYQQRFGHRLIEDAEGMNPTGLDGYHIDMPLGKVVDITDLLALPRKNKVHLAYFRLDYDNKHPHQKGSLQYHDWVCCIYISGKLAGVNMRSPHYFIGGMRENIEGHMNDVRATLTQIYHFQDFEPVTIEALIHIMMDNVPLGEEVPA